MEKLEFRVVWEREGGIRKVKRYAKKAGADRFMVLLGPEPWKAMGREPDAWYCCAGWQCGCDGLTVQAQSDRDRLTIPVLTAAHIESRTVGPWVCREPRPVIAPAAGTEGK